MLKFFPVYEDAFSHMTSHPIPLIFLIDEENFILFFISVTTPTCTGDNLNPIGDNFKFARSIRGQ